MTRMGADFCGGGAESRERCRPGGVLEFKL
jgi:hypothetical protein